VVTRIFINKFVSSALDGGRDFFYCNNSHAAMKNVPEAEIILFKKTKGTTLS